MHSYHKNSLFFSILFQESPFSLKESPLMIVLIRSLVLKRRICYLGNLECLHFLRFLCYLLGVKQSKVARCTANNSVTVQHLKDQVSKTTLPLQDVIYIVNIIVIFDGNPKRNCRKNFFGKQLRLFRGFPLSPFPIDENVDHYYLFDSVIRSRFGT